VTAERSRSVGTKPVDWVAAVQAGALKWTWESPKSNASMCERSTNASVELRRFATQSISPGDENSSDRTCVKSTCSNEERLRSVVPLSVSDEQLKTRGDAESPERLTDRSVKVMSLTVVGEMESRLSRANVGALEHDVKTRFVKWGRDSKLNGDVRFEYT
jgi:hypothetical protein